MRRLVAIHIKGGVAVSLWALGALCVTAEVRQPGFWYDKVTRSGDLVTRRSGDLRPKKDSTPGSQNVAENQAAVPASPEPAYQDANQNNEVAAEQQAAEIPPQVAPKKDASDSHIRQIVISIPDRRLALLVDGELVKVYPVAVGKSETPSPGGEFTVINHAVNPTYRHGDTEIGPGKDNPLGTRWMGLSLRGYGIHGTNVQSSVGKAASHGCFRMKKKDVEDLYRRVQVGDAVTIRSERDELTASLFGVPAQTVEASKGTEVATASSQPAVSGNEQ
jgi:lipoprotein-anchoring transpeptidase ErfK/SrfK